MRGSSKGVQIVMVLNSNENWEFGRDFKRNLEQKNTSRKILENEDLAKMKKF